MSSPPDVGIGIADGAQPCATSHLAIAAVAVVAAAASRPRARQKGEREGRDCARSAPRSLPTIRCPLRRPVLMSRRREVFAIEAGENERSSRA